MKITHVQTGLPKSGNVPYKIHEAMLNSGIESSFVVFDTKIDSDLIEVVPLFKKRIFARIYNSYHKWLKTKIQEGKYKFSNPITPGFDISKYSNIKNCDVIYIHWSIGGFLSLNTLKKLIKLGKPVVIFLHDMWPITGGCHHSFECEKYSTGCHNCPLFIDKSSEVSAKQLIFKTKLTENNSNVFFQSPSTWMTHCAKKSLVSKDKLIFQIPHLIDSNVFRELDKTISREKLAIPKNKKIIGFGAVSGLNNKFKGGEYLLDAISILAQKYSKNDIAILLFGASDNDLIISNDFEIINLGRLNDGKLLALAYNVMDVFVTPSLAESFGMTALEAISCRTPVVCFGIGGLIDIVKHKENGYVATPISAVELAVGIQYCLENELRVSVEDINKTDRNMEQHKAMLSEVINQTKGIAQ